MKWFIVLVLFTQAFQALSCAFEKVETLTGYFGDIFRKINENECFAKCFEDKACIGIQYSTGNDNFCQLFSAGKEEYKDVGSAMYIFQRHDVDPTGCTRYVGV